MEEYRELGGRGLTWGWGGAFVGEARQGSRGGGVGLVGGFGGGRVGGRGGGAFARDLWGCVLCLMGFLGWGGGVWRVLGF